MAIPAPFRKIIRSNESDSSSVFVTISDGCLAAYPEASWLEKIQKISTLNQLDKNVTAFKRMFIGNAQECNVDKAGRICLPQDLRKYAQIDGGCYLVGQLDKFEIWSQTRWERELSSLSDQVTSVCSALAEHGIHL